MSGMYCCSIARSFVQAKRAASFRSSLECRRRSAFTLVELLTSLAIVGVLVALTLPAIQQAREAMRRTQCANRERQIGLAFHHYESAFRRLPPSCVTNPWVDGSAYGISYGDSIRVGPPGFGWGALLLPFLEQDTLYLQFDFRQPCWSPINAEPAGTKVVSFLCPSASGGDSGFLVESEGADNRHGIPILRADGTPLRFSHSHYVTNAGINQPWGRSTPYCYDMDLPEPISGAPDCLIDGPFYPNSKIRLRDITDGLSTTIFLGERSSFLCNGTWVGVVPHAVVTPRLDLHPWQSENNAASALVGCHSGPDVHDHPQVIIHAPNNPFGHTDEMWGEHGMGCNVLLGDGSVRYFSAFTDPDTWVHLSTRNRGEVIHDES